MIKVSSVTHIEIAQVVAANREVVRASFKGESESQGGNLRTKDASSSVRGFANPFA